MNKPIGYIYITENNVNCKKYIGKHKKSYFDKTYLGSGVLLSRAINKYGKENFSTYVLEWCFTLDSLNEQEIKWIKFSGAIERDDFYNIATGGEGGDTYTFNLPERKLEISKKLSMSIKASFTDERRRRRSEISKSLWKNPEYRKRSIESKSGKNHHMYGKSHSLETRAKMSASRKGKQTGPDNPMYGRHLTFGPMSDECKNRLSLSKRSSRGITVIEPDGTIRIFFGMKKCAAFYGTTTVTINNLLKGRVLKQNTHLNKYEFLGGN